MVVIFTVSAVETRSAVKAAGEGKLQEGFIAVGGVGFHFEHLFRAHAVDKVANVHFHVFTEHMPQRAGRIAELQGKAGKREVFFVVVVNILNDFRKNEFFGSFFCGLGAVGIDDMVDQKVGISHCFKGIEIVVLGRNIVDEAENRAVGLAIG